MDLDWVRVIVLAVSQGLTTVFPISSSGHLVVVARLFGASISLADIARLHLGALIAVLLYYRRYVFALLTAPEHRRAVAGMAVAFATTVAVGLVLAGYATGLAARAEAVALLWVLNGLVLVVAAYRLRSGHTPLEALGLWQHAAIGLAQGFAVMPGISRLGVALIAAVAVGLTWREALRYAFLVSLPTVVAANVYAIVTSSGSAMNGLVQSTEWQLAASTIGRGVFQPQGAHVVAIVVAALTGWLSLRAFNSFVGRRSLFYFGAYCIVTGLFSLIFLPMF